jgi:hypothetical protein
MLTAQELEDMSHDYEEMDIEFEMAKAELQAMRDGTIIVVPRDVEHARAMFKMACFYLSQHDKDFNLTME